MATVVAYENQSGKRYLVRYRKPGHKQTTKRGFKTKKAAQLFAATVEVSKAHGDFIDESDGRITAGELGRTRIALREHSLKPSTWRSEESTWRMHVEPKWGDWPVSTILHSDVQKWVAELTSAGSSATTVLRAHGILAGILDGCVRDRRIRANPARGIDLPRKVAGGRAYLTHAQVEALAQASAQRSTLVYTLAYCGLRWGEAAGIRVKHLNTLRRRINVEENAVMVGGSIRVGTPKTHERRTVPYPAFLTDALAAACTGKLASGLVFGDGSTHIKPSSSRDGWFTVAVRACQKADPTFPTVSPHDLRHTAASLAISAGANVKAVQRMLGHASAAMTLDTYADLFDDDLDGVAARLDDARRDSVVLKMWSTGSA